MDRTIWKNTARKCCPAIGGPFAISSNATVALDGHILVCDQCGEKTYSYHSCKNRACPKCQGNDDDIWLEKRQNEILPVPYFHVTLTLPKQWRTVVRSNQKDLYGILMKADAPAITKLAADPKYIGGQVGILAVLHTWTRTMCYHPHVHCLVTGGGVSSDVNRWLDSRDCYLFPKKALSPIFRAIFLDMVRQKLPDLELPKIPWAKKMVIHVKKAGHGTFAFLSYLARYVHRVAKNNSQIKARDDSSVTFTYTENNIAGKKSLTLKAKEFIRRFLQHISPKKFHKVRYYGLCSTAKRTILKSIRLIMLLIAPQGPDTGKSETAQAAFQPGKHPMEGRKCLHCVQGTLVWIGLINPYRKERREPYWIDSYIVALSLERFHCPNGIGPVRPNVRNMHIKKQLRLETFWGYNDF